MTAELGEAARKLNHLLDKSGLPQLDSQTCGHFEAYLALLLRWNARTNLTAIRDEDGILRRHFLESIACARALPPQIGTLLDVGSGAGFPGIPIALCRPEIAVTLAESQGKKASFLREVSRVLGIAVQIHAGRAETLGGRFDCVTLRAVDRMGKAVGAAAALVAPGGWLAVLTTRAEAGDAFAWSEEIELPGSERRVLALSRRSG